MNFIMKKKKDKIFKIIENLLIKYNLPTKIILSKIPLSKNKLHDSIYKNIFLDKKRVGKNPRYISIKNLEKLKLAKFKILIF